MAGCLPEHMPVVITALQAMLEPSFNLAGIVATTHPYWPLVIVSGRAVRDLGMATQESIFSGGGARANMVIGRAIRLVTWNLGGAYPRRPVQEIMGHPGRMAYCIAEEPDEHAMGTAARGPWRRRSGRGRHRVRLRGAADREHVGHGRQRARAHARTGRRPDAGRGATPTSTPWARSSWCSRPSAPAASPSQGWSRQRVQQHLWERARRRLGDIRLNRGRHPCRRTPRRQLLLVARVGRSAEPRRDGAGGTSPSRSTSSWPAATASASRRCARRGVRSAGLPSPVPCPSSSDDSVTASDRGGS